MMRRYVRFIMRRPRHTPGRSRSLTVVSPSADQCSTPRPQGVLHANDERESWLAAGRIVVCKRPTALPQAASQNGQ